MLELKPKPIEVTERQQPRRLVLALLILLVALAGVVIKDRQFWFGTEQSTLDADEPVATQTAAKSVPNVAKPVTPAHSAKKQIPAVKTSSAPKPADAPAVATTRTVLPPLDVEVVAGDMHRNVHPGSNAAKVQITHPGSATPAQSAATFAAATDAAERERMSPDAVRPEQTYPMLAQQMRVQGSVVLQAIIGTDGIIQNLRVLTGPSILASAAEQAVREWRFKPILQNGQPVESKAKITVNFTIKVADGAEKATLAESRPLIIETLTR